MGRVVWARAVLGIGVLVTMGSCGGVASRDGCGFGESAAWMVATDGRARCITEGMAEVPGFEDYLRCRARFARTAALGEIGSCWQDMEFPTLIDCTWPPGGEELAGECINAEICRDGSLGGARCNRTVECGDFSDEIDCYEDVGRDSVLCGSELFNPATMCFPSASGCTRTTEPPLCDPASEYGFLCEDGSVVGTDVVCDRVKDCPDGRDESVCFRTGE
jgi:hypothetical protein